AHYCYLLMGNHGDSTWWVGAFVTFGAVSLCLQTTREVAAFSIFSLGCAFRAAAVEGPAGHSIYVPALATILLLAYIHKRGQVIGQEATFVAERSCLQSKKPDEARLQLAAIVESSGDAIVGSTLDGLIQSWNNGAERLFGYSAEEVVGQPVTLLLPEGQQQE